MTAMDGALRLESDGAGLGAVARLVLRAPVAEAIGPTCGLERAESSSQVRPMRGLLRVQ